MNSPASPGLVRGIGLGAMIALMINGTIGAGIFGLPSKVHAVAGPSGLFAFLGCGLVIAAIGLCLAEVASRFSETGGPFVYTRQALGPVVGFTVGWLLWVTRVTAVAAIANVMASYLAAFWPAAAEGPGRSLVISVAVLAWTAIIVSGVRQSATASVAFTWAKLAPLALFVCVGLFALDLERFSGPPARPGSLIQAVLLLVFAFGGFEGPLVLAGESKNPRRDMPWGLFGSLVVVTIFYVLIQVVCIGTLPGLSESTRPLADASARFMGAAGASIVTLGALISTNGTMFAAMFSGPRVLYAMAEQHQLPPALLAVHSRLHTPLVAIALTSGASLLLALSGTFVYLATLSSITRLIVYLGSAVALIVLRRRPEAPAAQVRIPGGDVLATLVVAACVWLIGSSKVRELRDVGIAIAIGLVLYLVHRLGARRGAESR